MSKKPKMLKAYTPEWEKQANIQARSYCPPIYPCKECGYPVIQGYCCNNCGCSDPSKGERYPDD